jgi:hypothetical protein
MANQPNLTFFCELPADEMAKLFSSIELIKQLRQLNANISMGLLDLSSTRADVVKKLTRAGIPVTAWLLVPKEQGYWTNLDNVPANVTFYGQFKKWTAANNLQWAAVGLDIEPHMDRIGLLSLNWIEYLPDLFKRLFRVSHFRRAEADLRAFVNLIRSDGFAVETYNFPFVIEERNASSEIITRALGTPPLDADREVLMLYSSFFEKDGDAILWSYAHQAKAIGVGSTGGGVDLAEGEQLKSMRWIDLRRDLLLVKGFTNHIYIFSLEGCVKNDYLDRLLSLDWSAKVIPPIAEGREIDSIRKTSQGLLWLLSHPLPLLYFALVLLNILSPRKK